MQSEKSQESGKRLNYHSVYCTQIVIEIIKTMKKTLAILSLVVFLGGMSAPIFANNNSSVVKTELADKDPKKKKTKKAAKKAEEAKKAEAEKKASDCSSKAKTSDCAKTCSGK